LRKDIPSNFTYRLLKHHSYHRVLLPKNWHEFEQHLGKNLAYKLRAEPKRRLKQFGVDGLTMANAETFELDFEAFIDLHTKRWNAKGQSGYFSDEQNIAALKAFCESMLIRGKLRLYVVRFGDQPGGALLAFQDERRICFFSCGFDDVYKKHQPVKVLIGQGIQDGIKLGLESFTFMKGKESYKLDWANDEQQLFRLVIARRTLRGLIGLWALTFTAKYRERRRSK
jgi:CelD/BcsL family acetyltransferase involved in cellulose biosynthesis